jgi:hypothetical protein
MPGPGPRAWSACAEPMGGFPGAVSDFSRRQQGFESLTGCVASAGPRGSLPHLQPSRRNGRVPCIHVDGDDVCGYQRAAAKFLRHRPR